MTTRLVAAVAVAAAAAAASGEAVVFHHFSDPQMGMSGDLEADLANFQRAVEHAVARAPSGLVSVVSGDLVDVWDNRQQLAAFDEGMELLLRGPVLMVPGNHDVGSERDNADLVLRELAAYRARHGSDFYEVQTAFATFLMTHSELLVTTLPELQAESEHHWAWLETKLRTVSADRPVFLVTHYPPFLEREDEPQEYFNWSPSARARLLELVRGAGVQHILCGHTHRTALIKPTDGAFTIYTVGGTAMAFDDNGFGYRRFVVDGSRVEQEYVRIDTL